MAILQAIFSLISRSAGKVLNAIFGWAVRALFGQPAPNEQTLLSVLVALAAGWPLLVLGIVVPKVAALAIAFIPFSKNVPGWIIRLVWLGLALIVPLVIGVVVAKKAPPASPPEPFWKRLLRGYPITVALAGAFFFMFVTIPFIRLIAAVRGQRSEDVPLVTNATVYHEAATQVFTVLNKHGLNVVAAVPPWWMSVPSMILNKVGGKAFRNYAPEKLEYFAGADLTVAMYPNAVMLRGKPRQTGWAHGLIAESLAHSRALQTVDPQAQRLEKRLHDLWEALDEGDTTHELIQRKLEDVVAQFAQLEVDYDQWQTLYRESLQLDRALHGRPQLLDDVHQAEPRPTIKSVRDEMRGFWRSLFSPRTTT